MLCSSCSRVLLLSLGLVVVGASTIPLDNRRAVQPRHEHETPSELPGAYSSHQSQHRHPQPLLELNETEVLLYHAPDPLSYWVHDFESDHGESTGSSNWRGMMALHVVGMTLAFFILLPVGKRAGCIP
jgi:hypothetical protein